jgi:predicted enzyme related to lactoylglutathione lyase
MQAKAITPILNVSDMEKSFAWFEKLGWTKCWDWGSPPTFGSVGSGECEIFLCLGGQGGRDQGAAWLSIWVDDVDSIHKTCIAQGVEVVMPPTDMPWSVREMHIRHPDGHVFRVGRGLKA